MKHKKIYKKRGDRYEYFCTVNNCGNAHSRVLKVKIGKKGVRYIPVCFNHYWHYYKEEPHSDISRITRYLSGMGKIGDYEVLENLKTVNYLKRDMIIDIKAERR